MVKRIALAAATLFVTVSAVQIHAQSETRFRARIDLAQTGDPAPDVRCPAGTVLVSFTGSGNVTRVGPVSAVASHCIVDDPAVEPFTEGEMTLSSDRGDILIEYEGNDAAGDLSGAFVIVGGTGDFAGATGGGTLSGRAGLGGGRGVLDGTMTLP
jgi:hypothetical protein